MQQTVIFKNPILNETFYKEGYVKHGKIDDTSIQNLIALNDRLSIPDFYGCGYNCGMNSDKYNLRKQMQEEINNILLPFTTIILDGFSHYSATFVNKMPVDDCFVTAHQDFSYTDEKEIPSFMCFIPLVDVDINNAALGFIPKSQLFYDNIRAFPFPLGKSAITENDLNLMAYLDIIPMKKGEMIFFNQKTIHGSFSNYSNTNRIALSFSLFKKNKKIFTYIHNPKTNGKTILKYEVDNTFIVNYNNPELMKMYIDGNINIPYEAINEIPVTEVDTSWKSIKQKLNEHKISIKKENLKPIIKHLYLKNKLALKEFIYNKVFK